jgi:hypothetical protein
VNVTDSDLRLVLGGSLFVYIMKSNCLRIDLWGNSCSVCWCDKKKFTSDNFFLAFCLLYPW